MGSLLAVDYLEARGHHNITARHSSTLEITKDQEVTPRGDCIIAVSSTKAAADLDPHLKRAIRSGCRVTLILVADELGLFELITGRGHPLLTLEDRRSIVVRKSSYVDARTVAIMADKAARDINREIAKYLAQPHARLKVWIIAYEGESLPRAAWERLEQILPSHSAERQTATA